MRHFACHSVAILWLPLFFLGTPRELRVLEHMSSLAREDGCLRLGLLSSHEESRPIPRAHLTFVLIGKGLILGGW